MRSTVAVIGAGAWGTTVAKVIADKGHDVVLWCFEKETADEINTRHINGKFLPGIPLPEGLRALTNLDEAASGREVLILAVPSLFLLTTVKQLLSVPSIREGQTAIAVITKGFLETPNGPTLILDTLEDYLPGFYRKSLAYIAGPSHAEEVARGKITGLISASQNPKNAMRFRYLLKSSRLLVFASLDVRGVQVAAAVKNVIAIAFGIMDALKTDSGDTEEMFGDNTESLLLAAGLNEIQILGMAMGATHRETFSSISGVGDLDVTCRSMLGRNRRFGREIVEKNILEPFKNLDDLLARIGEIGYMPEGTAAAKYVRILADKHRLRMPISTGLYQILNREIKPMEFLRNFLKSME
ncbi:MAG: NAD(P)-dependent glycerol-3-phosphate dehydrogenase [Spirochaetaceae bacterium]|jgi:glycerol-3-phosphate dehydrogenase (NAD(P)+)|nr:NAD(P)-dependent glycerol-3-phosphate dehydrogenase [Spirochaetaceae bacterium]